MTRLRERTGGARAGLFAGLLLGVAAWGPVSAAAQQQDLSAVEIRTERLAPGVAVLFGAGGNIGLSYGPDGPVLVDDQFAPLTSKIAAAVKALDQAPVRFVVNTHWHGDHTGGNEQWGRAGAVIIAQDNVRMRLSTEQFQAAINRRVPPSPKPALPVVTFDDGVTLHLNGDTLRVVHVAHAHTDGDSLVKWERANVLHTGDVFNRISLPYLDLSSGGSIQGTIDAADRILALSDASTKIVPGHGPVSTRDDVIKYRAMLVDVRDKVAGAIAEGRTLEQVRAAAPAGPYEIKGGFISADAFTQAVYESLRNPPKGHPHRHRH
jgi:cyclase